MNGGIRNMCILIYNTTNLISGKSNHPLRIRPICHKAGPLSISHQCDGAFFRYIIESMDIKVRFFSGGVIVGELLSADAFYKKLLLVKLLCPYQSFPSDMKEHK